MVITSIPLFIALIFIHVVVAEPKSCSLRVIFILIGVGFVLQAIVMGFLIGAWKSSDPKYELSWPWVMSIVSLCVIALIAGLHAFMVSSSQLYLIYEQPGPSSNSISVLKHCIPIVYRRPSTASVYPKSMLLHQYVQSIRIDTSIYCFYSNYTYASVSVI